MKTISSVRPSPIAGSWYPGDKTTLQKTIRGYIDHATPSTVEGRLHGLIVPHAGYFYSGATAGYAYRCVQGLSFDICVVLSPLHDYQPSDLLTSSHSAYATPLGEIPIATDLVDEIDRDLQANAGLSLQRIANDAEHSLEIQLPFLQEALKDTFQLVPIMVRTHHATSLQAAARCIHKALAGKRALIIASTDLSHFYPQSTAIKLDQVMTTRFTAFDPAGVLQAEAHQEGFACGAGAVALALWTTRLMGATRVTLLHHSTSADASGDTSRVVGYAAAAITG
jgi:AmmeMemoRadiSam system protein B